jgi:hypothetical protein
MGKDAMKSFYERHPGNDNVLVEPGRSKGGISVLSSKNFMGSLLEKEIS